MHIDITRKGQKLLALCEAEGFGTIAELVEANILDSVAPGICCTEGCADTCDVEPDQDSGFCEACGGQTVVSALRLAGLI